MNDGMVELKIKALLTSKSTEHLVDLLELTQKKTDSEVPVIRMFILNELEVRNPVAFEAYLDSCEDSPRMFML